MSRSAVAGLNEYDWAGILQWILVIVCSALLLVFSGWVWAQAFPSAAMTTRHTVFLPASFQLVERVDNVRFESSGFGGAGRIGAPQVEMKLADYQNEARPTDQVSYLALKHQGAHSTLDYFDVWPGKVIHAKTQIESPAPLTNFGISTGWFQGVSARFEGRELVIDRSLSPSEEVKIAMMIFLVVMVVAWLVGVVAICRSDDALVRIVRRIMGG